MTYKPSEVNRPGTYLFKWLTTGSQYNVKVKVDKRSGRLFIPMAKPTTTRKGFWLDEYKDDEVQFQSSGGV